MATAYKLTFKDLGRTKFSGSVIIKKFNYTNLAKAVRPYLGSTLDFYINKGIVYAGWHKWDFDIEEIEQ